MDPNHDPAEIEQGRVLNEAMNEMLARLRQLPRPFSISIAPEELRKWHENAYMPKSVSIGPNYNGTRMDLLQMDETKIECMRSFLHRPQDNAQENHTKCWDYISTLEREVRDFYRGDLKRQWDDLAKIMLCDACFLLEVLFSGSEGLNEVPGSRLRPPVNGADIGRGEVVLTDLMLLENQIPFFILRGLCELLFPEVGVSIETLALNLYRYSPDERLNRDYVASNLLDLVHSFVSRDDERGEILEENEENHHHWSIAIGIGSSQAELNRCAPILEAAGVKIIPAGYPTPVIITNSLDAGALLNGQTASYEMRPVPMRENRTSNHIVTGQGRGVEGPSLPPLKFDIKFRNGELEMSPLHITKETKKRWLNLIAWEQGNTGFGCKHYCTRAACLFDSLICCEGDIQLLKDRGVIVDHMNTSNQQLLEFFRSVVKGVDRDKINDSAYWKMVKDLSIHSATNYFFKQFPIIMWHSKLPKAIPGIMKFLKRGINIMLALISILSVVQTYYAVVGYTHPKH